MKLAFLFSSVFVAMGLLMPQGAPADLKVGDQASLVVLDAGNPVEALRLRVRLTIHDRKAGVTLPEFANPEDRRTLLGKSVRKFFV